jgi:hypothetical protein
MKEIQQKAKIDEAQLEWIMDFLTEYDFIVMDEAGKKVRLDKTVQEFLAKTTTA